MINTNLVLLETKEVALDIWVDSKFNKFELKELILFTDKLKEKLRIEILDSVDYEGLKLGWRIKA